MCDSVTLMDPLMTDEGTVWAHTCFNIILITFPTKSLQNSANIMVAADNYS
jgi:hypothetical protein